MIEMQNLVNRNRKLVDANTGLTLICVALAIMCLAAFTQNIKLRETNAHLDDRLENAQAVCGQKF